MNSTVGTKLQNVIKILKTKNKLYNYIFQKLITQIIISTHTYTPKYSFENKLITKFFKSVYQKIYIFLEKLLYN